MIKMYTYDGNWVVKDGDKTVVFGTSYDAWCFIFLLREIRPGAYTKTNRLYPVRSLDPRPERRLKNVRVHT